MLALYRSGRQTDALEAYRGSYRHLRDELGLEPGPRLRELEQAILRHDASLGPLPLRARLASGSPAAAAARRCRDRLRHSARGGLRGILGQHASAARRGPGPV